MTLFIYPFLKLFSVQLHSQLAHHVVIVVAPVSMTIGVVVVLVTIELVWEAEESGQDSGGGDLAYGGVTCF